MKATMNNLDILAEVAASCKDDEKSGKLQHSEEFVEPQAELTPQIKSNGSVVEEVTAESVSLNNNFIPLPNAECSKPLHDIPCGDHSPTTERIKEFTNREDMLDTENVEPSDSVKELSANEGSHGDDAPTNIEKVQDHKQPGVSDSATNNAELAVDNSDNKCTCPKINNAVVCGSACTLRPQSIKSSTSPQLVHPIRLSKDCNKAANVEHAYPSTKPAVDAAATSTASASPTESLAQRVTRLLSPNFKLTMTDAIPSVLQNRNFSSLLIGNVGSATMRTALTSARIFPHPVTVRQRATINRKYPNISMSAVPVDHPLLDHDYCYQNYYEIVQAAAKLVKERNAKKKMIAKQEQKAAFEEGQPVKRKYRTKRIIAEEMKAEADRRAALNQRVLDGDEQAQKELEEIEHLDQEKELNAKKKSSKKKRELPIVEPGIDSDDEVMNEITEDIDTENPVQDHDSAFKDQFVYFGSKKYQSRSRPLNKAKDPYELFWSTGQLNPSISQTKLNKNQDQEINDVLDVLGISPCESQADTPSDCNADSICSTRSNSTSSAVADNTTDSNTSINNDSDASPQQGAESNTVKSSVPLAVGIDDLLQGITVDQVSELIHELNTEPNLDSVGVSIDGVFESGSTEKASVTTNGVRSLSALATDACIANNVQLPDIQSTLDPNDNQCLSQQTQVSNISLDFTEADLLASDRSIDLDILNNLSSTPPRSTRPASLFLTPSSTMASTDMISLDSPEKPSKAPMVVPVTMYWNTFPALLLDGVKYVRLIDISRQALPSKETGLLKKRAQSLGYEVITCTDLQRNLLVNYAFACPSRSNLMVSETAAADVIASYMEKSEMEELSKAPELTPEIQSTKVKPESVTSTGSNGSSSIHVEPEKLMPQVLIEHKPLQQSSNAGGNKTPSTHGAEPTAPERASRLRQIKSSYRRFLPRSTSTANGNTSKDVGSHIGQEENASDRGYHSDQSPDSLDRPLPTKSKSNKKGKPSKSARRSLSTAVTAKAAASITPCESVPEIEIDQNMGTEMLKSVEEKVELADASPPSPSISPTIHDGGLHQSQRENAVSEPMLNVMTKSEIVHIRHTDFAPKRNGKLSYQDGELYLEFFKSLHSPCIQCCNCRQFYTLRSFSKHQHTSRKLATVKIRQRTEPRGTSIGSELWQLFQKKKQLFEANRAPLKKLSETRLSKSLPLPEEGQLSRLFHSSPTKLGKRIPKQKKYNPDEVYYSNPCIRRTSRKRQAEADLDSDRKRIKPSNEVTNIEECVER